MSSFILPLIVGPTAYMIARQDGEVTFGSRCPIAAERDIRTLEPVGKNAFNAQIARYGRYMSIEHE